jgi:predicted nucleotidyltransferase
LGAYVIGSLAHGGFGRYSDIDVAVIAENPLTPFDLDEMRKGAAAVSTEHAAKLSIFWTDRSFAAGRFPPLDRIDYLDHAVCLIEREAIRPERPPLAEVRAYLRGAPFERWAARARDLSVSTQLAAADRKPYLRALLYPARFIYSWSTGAIASNDDAVAFVQKNGPRDLDLDLIAEAHRCRLEGRDPDYLFAARGALVRSVAACAGMIAETPEAGDTSRS